MSGIRLASRQRIYGVGVNDADYVTQPIHGLRCPYFDRWHSMLRRCYSSAQSVRKFKTELVHVESSWQKFSNFKSWMEHQDWREKCLDKDWIGTGTLYSAHTCVFLPQTANTFLQESAQNGLPLGVFEKFSDGRVNKFVSQIHTSQGKKHLGVFSTASSAHRAWKNAKLGEVAKLDPLIRELHSSMPEVLSKLYDILGTSHEVYSLHKELLERK